MNDSAQPMPIAYLAALPGPDRKRTPSVYQYRLVFRKSETDQSGCVAMWEVTGGRMPYQVALELDTAGRYAWHCTCADAVYKAEEQGRLCKHVQGLLEFGAALPKPKLLRRSA